MNQDKTFLQQAIENSRASLRAGNFPAGAIVVKDGKVLSSEISVPYPGLLHADSKAVFAAHEKDKDLKNATLYIGLESCLMCIGATYWAGIRRVVFAIPKSKVSGDYYETHKNTSRLIKRFNEKIEMVHLKQFEKEALEVVHSWEKENKI